MRKGGMAPLLQSLVCIDGQRGSNASRGEVWLYDPDLDFVKGRDVSELIAWSMIAMIV